MRKLLMVIFFLLTAVYSFSQPDSIYAKVQITSISMTEHREWIDTSIVITLQKFGCSDIVRMGKIDEIEIGFQFELFKSNLGEKNSIQLGIAFFTKEGGKWKMYYEPTYRSTEYKIIGDKSGVSEKDITHVGTGMQGLQVDYQTQVYIIKK